LAEINHGELEGAGESICNGIKLDQGVSLFAGLQKKEIYTKRELISQKIKNTEH